MTANTIFSRAIASALSRILAGVLLLGFLSSCTSLNNYYRSEDAPEHVKQGKTDFRLAITKALGPPLAPIVRNIKLPFGNLRFSVGLEEHLKETLQPLDFILVRAQPAITRFGITGHFTHVLVWLGTHAEMRYIGSLGLLNARAQRGDIRSDGTIYESAKDAVRLADLSVMINTDEILIMRTAPMSRSRKRQKYELMSAHLGTPFDNSFDFNDKTRLTCIEVVAEVFPEFAIPTRYSTGRFALVPDDLAQLAVSSSSQLRIVEHIVFARGADGAQSFKIQGAKQVRAVLSKPKEKRK
ncbi:MAG: hypothetical protein COA52_09300 [Hyphomicrobiales bacterium]|nr:MAG: hypothetical protein COA52_09300 [Hyphomicrobiales bacterium]